MGYITRAEFERRYGEAELADLTEENAFNAASADADALIDGYLASRYTLPLSVVPSLVESWAADVLRFKLWDERAPEEVRTRYDDVLEQLKLLSQGLIALPPGADGTKPAGGLAVGGYSNDRVFTQSSLADY